MALSWGRQYRKRSEEEGRLFEYDRVEGRGGAFLKMALNWGRQYRKRSEEEGGLVFHDQGGQKFKTYR